MEMGGATLAGPLTADRIVGGRSNLTFVLTDGRDRWVLRTPPRAGRTPSAHDVEREFRVCSALQDGLVPVPRQVISVTDEHDLGGPYVVAEFVAGASVQSRSELDALDETRLIGTVSALVETLAALHRVDHVAVGLERFGRADAYAARQLRRWSGQWQLVAPDDADVRTAAAELQSRLAAAIPEQRAVAIVHGDYRIDNTILALTGADGPRVAAVLDWELATIGDPVADVAMMCAYRDPAFDLIVGETCAWTSSRIADADGLAAAYESAGGASLDHWTFHLALAHYKVAVIAAGIDHRYRAGAAAGSGHQTAREAVAPYLRAGLALGALTD
ncbi:phosphotransferase family protein [Nocardioides sp. BGMRC 2183]|nr:phosphotransferase family protein [Nocardioides sp. BGMRC 2183]